jgi:hypothetical protein
MAEGMITPDELRRIAEEKEMAQLREALEKKRKADEERHHLHDAFMAEELVPDVFERASRMVKGAAERGEREVLAIRFPSEYCTDRGRAINNFEPNWPETLTGFAKRAHEFFLQELQPKGVQGARSDPGFPRWDAGESGYPCGGELCAGRAGTERVGRKRALDRQGRSGDDRPPSTGRPL